MRARRSREHKRARTRRIRFALASSSRIGVGMSSPEYLTCRQRREAAYKTRTKCIVTSEPSERGAKRREEALEAPKNGRSAFGCVSRGSGKTGKFRLRRGGGLGSLSVDRLGKEMSSFPRERRRPSSRRKEREKTKRATSFRARRRVSRRDERSWRRLLRRRRRSNRPFRGGRTSRGGERRSSGAPAPFAFYADGDESDLGGGARPRGGFSSRFHFVSHWRRGVGDRAAS